MTRQTFVYRITEPCVRDASRFGGKASGLARMAEAGLPIPPAFVIGTGGFHEFRASGGRIGGTTMRDVEEAIRYLEIETGRSFAGVGRPLLVSVRSGAAVSMPGMMDTILNLGLESRSAFSLAKEQGRPDFVLDTWLRFWRMFCDTVLGLDADGVVAATEKPKVRALQDFTPASFDALEAAILDHIRSCGETASKVPLEQLEQTIAAVFRSWDSKRAQAYRKYHGISDDLGTAVTVQAMVFGNAGDDSGSGVAFSRNPNDGRRGLYGEYLIGRQGEDLVAGTHTPIDLSDPAGMAEGLRQSLCQYGNTLEGLYGDAVDIEFTVERGRLYLLQVRPAKRTAAAAIRIAEDLVSEGLVPLRSGLKKVSVDQLKKVSRPAFGEAALGAAKLLCRGLGSSPGHASGAAILDSDRAAERAEKGEATILLRPTTSPQDIRGMLSSNGIVTAKGGALSHAAVVSRALDKPCIVGCEAIDIDLAARTFGIGGQRFREGDQISIDGSTGAVYQGTIPLEAVNGHATGLKRLLSWADEASEAMVWPAPRNFEELKTALQEAPAGLGVIGLADILIAGGRIDRFVELIGPAVVSTPNSSSSSEISEVVRSVCQPYFAAALGVPVHLRLPRFSSDRARRLIANWEELPASVFLPLGSRSYLETMLSGIAAAARQSGHENIAVMLGGISSLAEFSIFRQLAGKFTPLTAGAMIQNCAALQTVPQLAQVGTPLWLEIPEIVRTACGFIVEVQQCESAIDDYVAAGNLERNPLRQLPDFLESQLGRLAVVTHPGGAPGIDSNQGGGMELTAALFRLGFRRFSTSIARRNEFRLLLGQQ